MTIRPLTKKDFDLLALAADGKVWTRNTGDGARWFAERGRYPFVTQSVLSLIRRGLLARGEPDATGKTLATLTKIGAHRLDATRNVHAEVTR